MQTVVGLYRTINEANQVRQALLSEGYSGGDVTVVDQSESDYQGGSYASSDYGTTTGSGVTGLTGSNTGITDTTTAREYGGTATAEGSRDTGVGAKIKHFFQDLAGHDEDTHSAYTEGLSRGGALVAVNVSEGEVDRAAAILRQYGATDVEGNAGYSGTGTSTATTGTVTGEQVIPVVAEELVVGKREVERGGVRVFSRVVSEPVSESVSLHDERVVVDRRNVNRAATEADFTSAGHAEVRAMGEEAVVGKAGRVVEEVVVGKTAADRTETVQDTVRHTEVDVEPVSTTTTTARTTGTNSGSKF